MNTVLCVCQKGSGISVNAKQVIYASAFSTAEAVAELGLSLKKTITLEMYTNGCSKSPGQ